MCAHPVSSLDPAFRVPWNKGRTVGPKPPLKLREIWALRIRLQLRGQPRDLAIDSKLRGCDLMRMRVRDVVHGEQIVSRATVIQSKTGRPVRFELTDQTREILKHWIRTAGLRADDYLFPSRGDPTRHIQARQYGRIVKRWVGLIGLDPYDYGTHSLRRTKAILIYRRTWNLRAVQPLRGSTKVESTARYLGMEPERRVVRGEHAPLPATPCSGYCHRSPGLGRTP